MRGRRAAKASDRISRSVILTAGVSCGALVLFVGLPLAKSNPYPTPRDGGWVAQSDASYQLASATMVALTSESQTTKRDREAVPKRDRETAIEWEALTAPTVTLEKPAMMATIIPDPIWGPDPFEPLKSAEISPTATTAAKEKPSKQTGMQLASVGSVTVTLPAERPAAVVKRPTNPMDEVDNYLWEVYQREPAKKDSTGDFTWKDVAAAKRMGKDMQDYVIRGMDRDFREQLYHAGKAMDAAGIKWSMLSAFRDDYRQQIASGFKARSGNSLHGGSRAVGGYGHGRASDVIDADGHHETVWRWIDRNGAKYGLRRPMPGADPAHIQAGGSWQSIASSLRNSRTRLAEGEAPAKDAPAKSKTARNSR
jgi:hypothetical protein